MPQPQNEIDVLRDVSERFDRADVAYMLTGSMAMIYYAQPRTTRDIDFVVELAADKAEALVSALRQDYYVSPEAVEGAIRAHSMFNVIHQETLIKVDCIVRKNAPYREVEFSRRIKIRLEHFDCWIVRKEDLIISKLEWARGSHSEIQLRDVRALLATGFDSNYLRGWTDRLGLDSLLRECLHE